MCGNLGLLIVYDSFGRLVVQTVALPPRADSLKEPAAILREMVAATEIRGGQAGGLSAFEFSSSPSAAAPAVGRVRAIARKRYPLADDLAALFRGKCPSGKRAGVAALSVVGHTRFATGSLNKVPELHPHDWGASGYRGENRPFDVERVWRWDPAEAALVARDVQFGVHLTHNGDFDACELYAGIVLNSELGLWLERALHTPNSTTGDSPKMAGLVSLMRVQGRWAPAARLAWLRVVCRRTTDLSGGERLSKGAPDVCPTAAAWAEWAAFFEAGWERHRHAIVVPPSSADGGSAADAAGYAIAPAGVRALCADLAAELADAPAHRTRHPLAAVDGWAAETMRAFVHHAVRGFLHADLYDALAEALSRAHGSFGLQVHCTLEPGVVALGCKGQPMGIAFSADQPLVLFGSEASALQVAVTASGRPLTTKLDLDETGEVVRVGPPAPLAAGCYSARGRRATSGTAGLVVGGGLVELRAYALEAGYEARRVALQARCRPIDEGTPPFDPLTDQVALDLRETPAVLHAIDQDWADPASPSREAASALGDYLLQRMEVRRAARLDTIDLLIGGVEVSLWLAQQFASDMRAVFPSLTVKCVSTNKLLGISGFSPRRTFFAGNERISATQIKDAAVLLVSQSGQTFPSLHATRLLASLAPERVWLLTGTKASKMEAALAAARLARGEQLAAPRVILTQSGHRPAEPSSLAVAAAHHTLTHLLLHLATHVRNHAPGSRLVQPWERQHEPATDAPPHSFPPSPPLGPTPAPVPALAVLAEPVAPAPAGALHANPYALALADANATHAVPVVPAHHAHPGGHAHGNHGHHGHGHGHGRAHHRHGHGHGARAPLLSDSDELLIRLSDGCLADMRMMVATSVVRNVATLVGADQEGKPLDESGPRRALLEQGRRWAAHVREPWIVLVLVGCYVFVTLVLGIPIVGLVARLLLRAAGVRAQLGWSLDEPLASADQHVGYTVLGFIVRLCDAAIYVFLGKLITWGSRLAGGRPLWARHGKRTLVIVESPTNHQMLEAFVSKLFAQSYSFCSLDVHGASGVDHFVHRFTHRVSRGVLIAVGRPDGRLCCLAKTEASLILACKQAAFIANPAYSMADDSGNAPEIVSLGHNPFKPAGVVSHIALPSSQRRRFVDELVYEKLHEVQGELTLKPTRVLNTITTRMLTELTSHGYRSLAHQALRGIEASVLFHAFKELPMGAHFIPREDRTRAVVPPPAANLIAAIRASSVMLRETAGPGSDDPHERLAFATKLDARTHEIQDRQLILQQFYEGRVAALERYISFCVMFHAMAAESSRPWLLRPWNIARSQSNLRVATTAAPVSASDASNDSETVLSETRIKLRLMAIKLRRIISHM